MNLAILIDAENILPAHADQIFSHAASLGDIVYKEIYGTGQALGAWVEPVLKYAIHPNLTIKASKGKNSSDIALVIGAMDLLAAGGLDAVIIASSDSDFSALSVRLRNAGIEVIGMGTDKANPLWRTACSGFVPFQPPKPAQQQKPAQQKASQPKPAQAQKQQAKQSQPKPQPPQQPQKQQEPAEAPAQKPAVAATHAERAVIIRDFISAQLEANGGRMQSNALFTALNNLPEYRVDQQRSKRRPLNYLTRQYADAFDFEDGNDGNNWISFPAADQAKPAPEDAAEASAEAEAEAAAVIEAPAAEPPVEEVPAPPEEAGEAPAEDPLRILTEAGLPEDVAGQIVVIFTESANLREAYNKLRATFGNNTGREYYQKVKEIAGTR